MLSSEEILRAPKVLLHDHVDGGLRAASMIEMANESGYRALPFSSEGELADWYEASCSSGSLVRYLETFTHTIALMQTKEQIIRVAREAVIDIADSGVVYAEIRGAPELFTEKGLSIREVVEAHLEGYAQGVSEARLRGKNIRVGTILCGMRQNNLTREVAELTIALRKNGVVGFDIAGPEAGYPPTNHLSAFTYLHENGFPFTIHAGEADGVESISKAIHECKASRIGHGVRLIDDIDLRDGLENATLSPLAKEIRDRQIALELAPTSNVQTGAALNYESHPIGVMKKLGFAVTLNTDNRLMSRTSMVREATEIAHAHNWSLQDLEDVATNAISAAFIPPEEREEILSTQIRAGYREIENGH